jgi:hypothetical protein
VSTGATLLTAVGSGVNAYFSIVLGDTKKERSETLIIEKTIEAAIQALQQQFDASQQNFQSAMNFQETLRSIIANTMADYFEISTSIVRNTKV